MLVISKHDQQQIKKV